MQDENTTTPKDKRAVKVPSLLQNYLSLGGISIVLASVTGIVLLLLIEWSRPQSTPYIGILTYFLLPAGFAFGMFVILVGVFFEKRRRRKLTPEEIAADSILDLSGSRRRRFLVFVFITVLFLFVTAYGSYRGYEYTESNAFCGIRCHVPMKPEFTAFQSSPHARLHCVDCHVGEGAEWYVKSKLNGVRQLYGVVTGHFERPIKTPVQNMRPAIDTCAKCHWPEKFHGDVIRVFDHYGYDEENSLNRTRLLVKVGGGSPSGGASGGIHWHMNVANEVRYIATDEKRQNIPWVQMKDSTGKVTEYVARTGGLSAQQIAAAEKRTMDCMDCHNRPAHIFLSPNDAVDQSLSAGKLDISLPYIKAKAVEFLNRPFASEEEAMAAIAGGIDEYYRTTYPSIYSAKGDSIKNAAAEVQRLFQINFFPEMKTNWATHVNNIGHRVFQGCFRCHDGQHSSADGRVIRNECNICHTTMDQTFRGKTTIPPDGKFQHPISLGDRGEWLCATCHRGDRPFRHPVNLGDISRFQCAECHAGIYEKVKYQ